MSTTAAAKTSQLLLALWERNLPVIRERLDLLDRAGTDAGAGHLSPELRSEAGAAAHKLAGALGMYGFGQCTAPGRELEHLLVSPGALDHDRVRALTDELRRSLQL